MIWFIVIGLVAGALAKLLTPGSDREPKGCLMTSLLGMAGAIVMGLILGTFGGGYAGPSGLIGATVGAILLILAFRKFWK